MHLGPRFSEPDRQICVSQLRPLSSTKQIGSWGSRGGGAQLILVQLNRPVTSRCGNVREFLKNLEGSRVRSREHENPPLKV